ncbi:hypothetical protein SAMN05661012_00725 [Chitinophaga sancti]|uniref:Uncharacterized protein n=1 Tax=Chitinophaga sancti TaxID=1004 RepID=A0A1K1MN62_9BACT|nr:hypothetical protein SAMN05661012_00725 [Chitinophaga sancti]
MAAAIRSGLNNNGFRFLIANAAAVYIAMNAESSIQVAETCSVISKDNTIGIESRLSVTGISLYRCALICLRRERILSIMIGFYRSGGIKDRECVAVKLFPVRF